MGRWRIGEVTVTKIVELELGGGTLFTLPQSTQAAVQQIAWLPPHYVDAIETFGRAVLGVVVRPQPSRPRVGACPGNATENRPVPRGNKLQGPFLAVLAAAGYP